MIEIEAGTGNVYADLGRADANEMQVKRSWLQKLAASLKPAT
jgi:hypothetical protein